MILAAIALFLGLARSSNWSWCVRPGVRACGFLLAPVVAALVIGASGGGGAEPDGGGDLKAYDTLRTAIRARQRKRAVGHRQTVCGCVRAATTGRRSSTPPAPIRMGPNCYDVTFLTFDAEGAPLTRIEAAEAVLVPGAWVLTGAKRWPLASRQPRSRGRGLRRSVSLPTDLTRDAIRDSFGTPVAIAIWESARLYRRAWNGPAFRPAATGSGFRWNWRCRCFWPPWC